MMASWEYQYLSSKENIIPINFEIVEKIDNGSDSDFDFCKPFVNGVKKFQRLVIRRKK